jgi:hypothetical protein
MVSRNYYSKVDDAEVCGYRGTFALWCQEIIIVKLTMQKYADIVECSHDDDEELL